MARIGLLGGTFDPIHNAHINIAKEAYEQLNLDEIWFIPVLNNPFEKKIVATNEQRVKMIELASKDYSYMKICDIELKKDPNVKSYTYDTLKELNEIYDHEFYFKCGLACGNVMNDIIFNEGTDSFNAALGGISMFRDLVGLEDE